MSVEVIESRVKELMTAVEQAAGQYNALVGRLSEARELLDKVMAASVEVAPAQEPEPAV